MLPILSQIMQLSLFPSVTIFSIIEPEDITLSFIMHSRVFSITKEKSGE